MAKSFLSSSTEQRAPAQGTNRFPWWVSSIVVLGVLLSLAGGVISKVHPTLLTDGSPLTAGAGVYTDYMFARSIALAAMLLLLLLLRARQMLAGLMVFFALIQMLDVIDDLLRGAFLLVPGLLVLAIVFLLGASRLFGRGFWQRDGWSNGKDGVA